MADPVYVEELVGDFLLYAKKKYYDKKYLDNMAIFMDYLTEEQKVFNLALKKDCEQLQQHAINIVRGSKQEYPLLKATKVERGMFFNSFVDYLCSCEYKGRKTKLQKIPFVMNDLERKLDIVKHYREYYMLDKLSAQEVADKYYVNERIIRNDKKEIKEGKLNAFGQKIDIEYDYDSKSFFSTPVPIFTVQNITQIVTMLNGLGLMYQNEDYRQYALFTAATIWNQLTLTVKNRIKDELVDLLDLDKEWYELVADQTNSYIRGFYPERYMDNSIQGNILKYLKNGMLVDIVFEGERFFCLSAVRIIKYEHDSITVLHDNEEKIIPRSKIVKVIENGN